MPGTNEITAASLLRFMRFIIGISVFISFSAGGLVWSVNELYKDVSALTTETSDNTIGRAEQKKTEELSAERYQTILREMGDLKTMLNTVLSASD